MKRSIKIASIVLAVIFALTIGIVLYDAGAFVSTERLQTEGFKELAIDSETHIASFYSDKVEVADVSVDVGLVMPQQGLAYMQFYIGHEVGMLDSLYLEFTPTGAPIQVYLEKPGAQLWPPMVFQTSSDGISTIVGVDDLGLLGTGTIPLNFYLGSYQTNESFWFEVNFTMHATGSLLTRQVGSAQIELPIAFANAT
ncbi:MAG: hypothetical protein ABSC91_01320 [Candidatus Bathyarchaeia archaeon]|jgi:hypothetical protein